MMDHMFADHNDNLNSGKGACGTVGGSWCVKGDSYTATQGTPLYAYCTKDSTAGSITAELIQLKDSISSNKKEITTELAQFKDSKTGVFLLYEADNFHYYKIPVAFGTTMKNGEVSRACHSYGMEAVCMGPSSCTFNSDNCRITPLSTYCGSPMHTLSQLICDGKYPNQCPIMDHMFAENSEYNGGKYACGTVGGLWCAKGDSYTSTQGTPLYAYCTK